MTIADSTTTKVATQKISPCGDCPITPKDRRMRQAIIVNAIKMFPAYSSRRITDEILPFAVAHKTVTKEREKLLAKGEIPYYPTLEGKDRKKRKKSRASSKLGVNNDPVFSCLRGENSDLFVAVERLYFREGDRIADVTYGAGAFWKKIDLSKYEFFPSDLRHDDNKFDFCRLPYPDAAFDIIVFDPPYVKKHSASSDLQSYSAKINTRYGLAAGTESYADILMNYEDGMAEGCRVLRRGGLLLVKCANFSDSTQRWLNEGVFQIASRLGLYKLDEFVLLRQSDPLATGQSQTIARKNHSYLQVFQSSKRKPK